MAEIIIATESTPATPAAGKITVFADSADGNLGFVSSAGVVSKMAPIASPTFTGTPSVPTAVAGTSTTQAASCGFVKGIDNNGSYRTVLSTYGSHIAAKVSGTYMMPYGDPIAVSGTGTLYPIATLNIVGADWPTINGITPKLRTRMTVETNAVAPTGNFTMGLYPLTSSGGAAGLKTYATGTVVAGSTTPTVTAPAASSMQCVTGADFALPADGLYGLAVVTTATIATSALVHINGILQLRNT